jgi:hypothetical protein
MQIAIEHRGRCGSYGECCRPDLFAQHFVRLRGIYETQKAIGYQ